MIQLRHTGIYVNDLLAMSDFYKNVFGMYVICESVIQKDELVQDILGSKEGEIVITKLITEQGKVSGFGDMIELIQVVNKKQECTENKFCKLYESGCMHLAFGVSDLKGTVEKIVEFGGRLHTKIHVMPNGNKCCMCTDIEENWMELIENAGN